MKIFSTSQNPQLEAVRINWIKNFQKHFVRNARPIYMLIHMNPNNPSKFWLNFGSNCF